MTPYNLISIFYNGNYVFMFTKDKDNHYVPRIYNRIYSRIYLRDYLRDNPSIYKIISSWKKQEFAVAITIYYSDEYLSSIEISVYSKTVKTEGSKTYSTYWLDTLKPRQFKYFTNGCVMRLL